MEGTYHRFIALAIIATIAATFMVSVVRAAPAYRLIKTANDPKVYLVVNNRRVHIPNEQVFEAGGYSWKAIDVVTNNTLTAIPDTELIKSTVDAKVYEVRDGKKAWIPNEQAFTSAGLHWDDIVLISQAQVNYYPDTTFNPSAQIIVSSTISQNIAQPEHGVPATEQAVNTAPERQARPSSISLQIVGTTRYGSEPAPCSLNNLGQVVGMRRNGVYKDIDHGIGRYPIQRIYDLVNFLWPDNMPSIMDSFSPMCINDLGQMLGYAQATGGATVFDGQKIMKIGLYAGMPSSPVAINNSLQVLGYGYGEGGSKYFLWHQGRAVSVDTLTQTDNFFSTFLNDKGHLVGGVGKPLLWDGKQVISFDTDNAYVRDLNNLDQFVGERLGQAYMWTPDKHHALLLSAHTDRSVARSINELGEIVGMSYAQVGDPPADILAHFKDNEQSDGAALYGAYKHFATYWQNGDAQATILDNIIDPDLQIHLYEAWSINDRGQILVDGFDKKEALFHQYLLQLSQ